MGEDTLSVRPKIRNSTSSQGMSSNVVVKGTPGLLCRSGAKNMRGQIQCNDCGVVTHSTEEFLKHGQVSRMESGVKCADQLRKPFSLEMSLGSTSDIEMEIKKKLSVIQGPPPSLKVIGHLLDQNKEVDDQALGKVFVNTDFSPNDDIPNNFNDDETMSTQHILLNSDQKKQLNILMNFEVQQRMEEQGMELKMWKEDLERREMELYLKTREDEVRRRKLEMEEAKRLLGEKMLIEQKFLVRIEREETLIREKELFLSKSINDKEKLNQMNNVRLEDKTRTSHQGQVNTSLNWTNEVFNSDDEENISNGVMNKDTLLYNAVSEEQQTIWNDVKNKYVLKDEREKGLPDGKEHSEVLKEQLKIFEEITNRNKQKKIDEEINIKLIQKLCLEEQEEHKNQTSNHQFLTDISPHVNVRENDGSGRIFASAVGSVKKSEEAKNLAQMRLKGLKANAEAMGQFVSNNSVPGSQSKSRDQYVRNGADLKQTFGGMKGKDHMLMDNWRTSSDTIDLPSTGCKGASLEDHWVVCQKKETQRSKKRVIRNEKGVKERSKSPCMSELDDERRKAAENMKKRIAVQDRETRNKMTKDTIAREWEEANKRTLKEDNVKVEMQLGSRLSRGGTKEKTAKDLCLNKWARSSSGRSRNRKISGKLANFKF